MVRLTCWLPLALGSSSGWHQGGKDGLGGVAGQAVRRVFGEGLWPESATRLFGRPRESLAELAAELADCHDRLIAPHWERIRSVLGALRSPATTSALARRFGVTPGAVSQHLAVLRRSGLVDRQRSGRDRPLRGLRTRARLPGGRRGRLVTAAEAVS